MEIGITLADAIGGFLITASGVGLLKRLAMQGDEENPSTAAGTVRYTTTPQHAPLANFKRSCDNIANATFASDGGIKLERKRDHKRFHDILEMVQPSALGHILTYRERNGEDVVEEEPDYLFDDYDEEILFPDNTNDKAAVDCKVADIPCFDDVECHRNCFDATMSCINGTCQYSKKFQNNVCKTENGCLSFVIGNSLTGTTSIGCMSTNAVFTSPGCTQVAPFVCQCGTMADKNYAANAPVPSDCIINQNNACNNTVLLAQTLGVSSDKIPVMLRLPESSVRRLIKANPLLLTEVK